MRRKLSRIILLIIALLTLLPLSARERQVRRAPKRVIHNEPPSEYTRVGNTDIYYQRKLGAIYVGSVSIGSLDFVGKFGNQYYSSTYGDYGYVVAMQVDENTASFMDCLNGATLDGVSFTASVETQGEFARVYYTLVNNNEYSVQISLGVFDDVSVGNNISPNIYRMLDANGNPYGMAMKDNSGAQLCVLFGNGLPGVTGIDDFWFGSYYTNTDAYSMSCHYSSNGDSHYMVENAGYDCGIGWGWKDRVIPAKGTISLSYLIGVGDVDLQPGSSFEVTPDDPEGWNDLTRPHRLALNGLYESPAGLKGVIDYAVEDSEEWLVLTDTLESGVEFYASLLATFDVKRSTHCIRFRTRDQVGNITSLPSIEYADVSFHALTNIKEKTFTGDSLYQTNVTCDLSEGQYVLTGYQNNKNAGTASFRVEGVFPYTIGRKTYTFTINPQPFAGEVVLTENSFVYNGQPFTPEWHFSNEAYATLETGKDYTAVWSNNTLPGTGTLTVTGKGNYTGNLTANITIDKAPLTANMYTVTMPAADISYDMQPHAAIVTSIEGVGTAVISYLKQGAEDYTQTPPTNEGAYDVYLSIDEGTLYHGLEQTFIGSFTIYTFSATEWVSLKGLYTQLATANPMWAQKWYSVISSDTGILNVSTLEGLTVEKGHVVGIDLSGNNLVGTFPSMLFTFPSVKVLDLRNNNLTGDIENIIKEVYAYILKYAPTFMSELQTLNVTGNKLFGNVGLLAASTETIPSLLTRFPLLTTLWASGNSFDNVYPHLPATILNLDLTNQVMDLEMDIDLSNFDVDALASQIPTLFVYNHQEQSYNTTPYARLSNYPPTATAADYTADKPYWGVDAFLLNGNLGLTCLAGNTYKGASGDMLYVSYPIATEEVSGSYCYTKYTFRKGDANFVNGIDITDLQATINYIFGIYNTYPFNFTAADTYQDGRLNVQDVVCTANIIMEAEESPTESRVFNARRTAGQDVSESETYLYVRDGEIVLHAAVPIASFDIVFEGTPQLFFNLESQGYDVLSKQKNATSRFIGYTLSEQYIPAGETVIATYSGAKPVMTSAIMADQDARPVRASFIGDATSIGQVTVTGTNAEYYSPSGIRLHKPVKGINILKSVNANGMSSSKVVFIK